ncbi:hypothetical protein DFH09DRAFT_1097966 [Mycena vulgaris]|nr:hypothetical protein DFH09DRAFT_1097966 [Mycena vulgaris]
MASGTLAALKKGLKQFQLKIKKRKDELTAKLKRKERISSEDEQWLDQAANDIDETHILEAASILREYILDRDDAFARQLEAILARFGRQTRLDDMKTIRETQMTDYFHRIAAEKQ